MDKTIFLIDDDSTFNLLTKRVIVKHLGEKSVITEFTDPGEAAELILNSGKTPDYIFLDINMPEINGWEFLEAMMEEFPDFQDSCKVVMLTTSILPTDQLKADQHPAVVNYLNKPLDKINVQIVFDGLIEKTLTP